MQEQPAAGEQTRSQWLARRFLELSQEAVPAPGCGGTAYRHERIFQVGREDLGLAKLVEAHWDAHAILHEAHVEPAAGAKYAVWASEVPGHPLTLQNGSLTGTKEFCSGAGLVDRALVTAGPALVEIDLHDSPERIAIDTSVWKTEAFGDTCTASVSFQEVPAVRVVGEQDWYAKRPGFWQGACGPAAAWAGGAAGLVDYAMTSRRDDAHTLAHLAAMQANLWAMQTMLRAAGDEFDRHPEEDASVRALQVRHLVEQLCTDTLQRFGRALGPAPLVKNAQVSRRYAELEIFLRQCHAERDLETLGRLMRRP